MQTTCAAAALSPEKKRGRAGLTVPHRTLGRVFCNGGAWAKLGGERIEEWHTRWGRTAEAELRLQWRRRRSVRAERGRESESWRAQMAAMAEAGAAGRSWWLTRARPGDRMLATRQPSSAGSPRRRGAAVRARTRRGRERGGVEGESAGGLGRLRPAGQK